MSNSARDADTHHIRAEDKSIKRAVKCCSARSKGFSAAASEGGCRPGKVIVVGACSGKYIAVPYNIKEEEERRKNLIANLGIPPANTTGVDTD